MNEYSAFGIIHKSMLSAGVAGLKNAKPKLPGMRKPTSPASGSGLAAKLQPYSPKVPPSGASTTKNASNKIGRARADKGLKNVL